MDQYERRLAIGEKMLRALLAEFADLGLGLTYRGRDDDGDECMAVVVYDDMPRVQ